MELDVIDHNDCQLGSSTLERRAMKRDVSRGCIALAMAVCVYFLPLRAQAYCDGCDLLESVPAAFGTTIAMPLIAKSIDNREDSPYGEAFAFTALASGFGVYLAHRHVENSTEEGSGSWNVSAPVLLGTAATFLVFQFWPRSNGFFTAGTKKSKILTLAFTPMSKGGGLSLSVMF